MHVGAEAGRFGLELLEILVQVRECVLFDLRGQFAEFLPLRDSSDRLVAMLTHAPHQAVVSRLVNLERDEACGPPFRIWAMWMTFSGKFRRSITPFICNRQDISAEAMYSTPWR